MLACRVAQGGPGLEPAAAGHGAPPRLEADTRLPVGPLLLGGFSLVLVAVGAGFGWQASQEYDDWKAARTDARYAADPDAGQARVDELADDVRAHAITANVLMFSGAALTAVSVLWWLLRDGSRKEKKSESETAWRPILGPGHAGFEVGF